MAKRSNNLKKLAVSEVRSNVKKEKQLKQSFYIIGVCVRGGRRGIEFLILKPLSSKHTSIQPKLQREE